MSAYPFHTHTWTYNFKHACFGTRAHVTGENDEKHPAYIRFVSLTVFVATPLSRKLLYQGQTCQPLVKENLETHEKKSGDSTKNSEILFFP